MPICTAHLTGGAAKSPVWSQMFADVLEMTLSVGEADEVGPLGAALCAGVGAGAFVDLGDAVDKAVRMARTHTPDPEAGRIYLERYEVYDYLVGVLAELGNR